MNYWLIFLTGLTTGGFTCAAMQGGLLASVIASGKKDKGNTRLDYLDIAPVAAFLVAKLVSHVILGAGLGYLGNTLELSLTAKLTFQVLAALFMLGTAGNLLELHPLFRYFAITPPRFMYKLLKNTSHSQALFAPALLGLLTVFIPCGVTQAMEVVAITSGSPVVGALTMGAFVLGTSPMFAAIGIATARFSEVWRTQFLRVAAAIIVIMAGNSLNGVLVALDSPYSLNKIYFVLSQPIEATKTVPLTDGVQKVTIKVENGGYSPRYFAVRRGVPVELTLATQGGVYSCATAFTFKAFNIYEVLKPVDTKVHKFTPDKPGRYTFSCSMGMYSGVMEVI